MNLDGLPAEIAAGLRYEDGIGARWWVAYHPERPRGILRVKSPKVIEAWKSRHWLAFGELQPQFADVSEDIPDIIRYVLALPDPRYPDWNGYTRLALRLADERLVVVETTIGLAGPGYADVMDDAGAPFLQPSGSPRDTPVRETVAWTWPSNITRT